MNKLLIGVIVLCGCTKEIKTEMKLEKIKLDDCKMIEVGNKSILKCPQNKKYQFHAVGEQNA